MGIENALPVLVASKFELRSVKVNVGAGIHKTWRTTRAQRSQIRTVFGRAVWSSSFRKPRRGAIDVVDQGTGSCEGIYCLLYQSGGHQFLVWNAMTCAKVLEVEEIERIVVFNKYSSTGVMTVG